MAGKRVFARAPRRESQWLAIEFGADLVDNSSILSGSLNAAALALRPFTIVRTHLEVHFATDQQIASESQAGAIGMCVVSEAAAAVGVTAVPTPIDELDSDLWYLHQSMLAEFVFGDATGFIGDSGVHYSIDSKAMRKVNNDQNVIIVVQGAAQGEGSLISSMGRFLIKLH